jgi:hypothetical protein
MSGEIIGPMIEVEGACVFGQPVTVVRMECMSVTFNGKGWIAVPINMDVQYALREDALHARISALEKRNGELEKVADAARANYEVRHKPMKSLSDASERFNLLNNKAATWDALDAAVVAMRALDAASEASRG